MYILYIVYLSKLFVVGRVSARCVIFASTPVVYRTVLPYTAYHFIISK